MPVHRLVTGIDMYYESHGEGEPLVLIPATGMPCEFWQLSQVPVLSKHLNVIIFDPRGTGRSTHYKGTYTIEQMACDVVALLDCLRVESAHVLGHTIGGRIGLAMGLLFPGRVKSLILLSSGSGPAGRGRPSHYSAPGLPPDIVVNLIERGFEQHVRDAVIERSAYFTEAFLEKHADQVQAFYELVRPHHAELAEYVQLVTARHTFEATHRLGELTVPTLVVADDEDGRTTDHLSQALVLAGTIANSKYVAIERQRPGYFLERAEETNASILEWVAANSGPQSSGHPTLSD